MLHGGWGRRRHTFCILFSIGRGGYGRNPGGVCLFWGPRGGLNVLHGGWGRHRHALVLDWEGVAAMVGNPGVCMLFWGLNVLHGGWGHNELCIVARLGSGGYGRNPGGVCFVLGPRGGPECVVWHGWGRRDSSRSRLGGNCDLW